uniref:Uncharacterized protein n=1 Tax=Panagrolaimus superbus TaxID=310955 RepID=A0A914YID8_9BILA
MDVSYISIDCKSVRKICEIYIDRIDDCQPLKNFCDLEVQKAHGAIFDLFEIKPFQKKYEYCCIWKTSCDAYGIPYQFINSSTLLITSILYGARFNITDRNLLTIIHVTKKEIQIFDLEPNVDGYIFKGMKLLDLDCSDKMLKEAVTKGKKSAKIILSIDDSSNERNFQSILTSQKFRVLPKHHSNYILRSFEAIIDDMNGVCKKKTKIIPYFESNLFITKYQTNDKYYGSFEMKCF